MCSSDLSCFDTISICMSKGLGAPVGSVLVASEEKIHEARRVRKVLGGGMRQAGYLAAACHYALDHHLERLHEDHLRAKVLEQAMASLGFVSSVLPVQTNIVVSNLNPDMPLDRFLSILAENNILAVAFGKQSVRMVTHLDFNDAMLDETIRVLQRI